MNAPRWKVVLRDATGQERNTCVRAASDQEARQIVVRDPTFGSVLEILSVEKVDEEKAVVASVIAVKCRAAAIEAMAQVISQHLEPPAKMNLRDFHVRVKAALQADGIAYLGMLIQVVPEVIVFRELGQISPETPKS